MKQQTDSCIGVMKCEDIQAVLFGYMNRELGEARSDLIREHLRKCPRCQAVAAEIQETLDMMRGPVDRPSEVPERLSDERRARIVRSFMHPVLDWIYVHHVLVSIAMTAIALVLLFCALRRVKAWRDGRLDPGVSVTIGQEGR